VNIDREDSAKFRFKQCDENRDSRIDKKEALLETCQIDKAIFTLADKNEDGSIAIDELIAIPSRYAQYRFPYYPPPSPNDAVVYISPYASTDVYNLLFNAIDECDSNGDYKLDKLEVTVKECGFTEEEFLKSDINKDGYFENKDMDLLVKAKRFQEADRDANGELDFNEWIDIF
jgi:Ca2+-binding EF-hand superfamily protein